MSVRSKRGTRRGQAMVELLVGGIVFLTILMFGIHFAEVGYTSMKVTESAASAMWDTTGGAMHRWPLDKSPAGNSANAAAASATQRYRDFDGRSTTNGPVTITQVFTEARMGQVTCNVGSGPDFPGAIQNVLAMRGGYMANGGMTCNADGSVQVVNIPTAMKWFAGLKEDQVQRTTAIKVCAVGRPGGGGRCGGSFRTMVDDWGLGSNDWGLGNFPVMRNRFLPLSTNPAYSTMTWMMNFTTNPCRGAGMALMNGTVPGSGALNNDCQFWMSAGVEETLFSDLPQFSDGTMVWTTSPGGIFSDMSLPYVITLGVKSVYGCFLGRGGC